MARIAEPLLLGEEEQLLQVTPRTSGGGEAVEEVVVVAVEVLRMQTESVRGNPMEPTLPPVPPEAAHPRKEETTTGGATRTRGITLAD